jgi:diguanylate cyclase (GGDEF)-like protein/PAS domain S-box-containing protein
VALQSVTGVSEFSRTPGYCKTHGCHRTHQRLSEKGSVRSTAKIQSASLSPIAVQAFLEEALSQIEESVIAIDFEGRVRYMNAAAEQITGHQAELAAGKKLYEVSSIVDVLSGTDFAEAIADAHSEEPTIRDFRRALLLNLEERPKVIEYRMTAMRNGNKSRAGTIIVFRDLMKLRHSEQALEISEATHLASTAALHEERERARVTLNSIGDVVLSTDFRGRVTFLNAIAEKLTGWTLQGATGRLFDEVFPLLDCQSRVRIACPAMQAIIEDRICRSEAAALLVRPDGREIAVDYSASPIHDASGGVSGVVLVAHDVTVAKDQADTLTRLALYDSLTGLPNRLLLSDRLEHAFQGVQRGGGVIAILYVDLDRFKIVNDTDGHAVGDRLLQQVAHRLLACVRSTDTVSRHGGDEFVVLLPDVHSVEDAALCGRKIVATMNQPFTIGGREYLIGASLGIAIQESPRADVADLIKHADIAMYHAKSTGRNRVSAFSADMSDLVM